MASPYEYSHPTYGRKPLPYSNSNHDRMRAPLPPGPPSGYSPFDEINHQNHNSHSSHNHYNNQYHSGGYAHPGLTPSSSFTATPNTQGYDSDPFEDRTSIPLNDRKAKHNSTATIAPMLPHEQDDPFVRDVDPNAPSRKRRRKEQERWFNRKTPWTVYILTFVQICVFVAEIINNAILTKSPIEIHPSFNPMIGPSPYVMINMGSRFDPCMHNITGVQDRSSAAGRILWPCPNATSTTPGGSDTSCSLHELCGFGAQSDSPAPNQWWRFIIPMFIHAGIIHIGFNLLLQVTLGRDVEKLIGSVRFALVYFASGIFGFVLGGNFAADGISSCGCSGSLFGIMAITLIDLFYNWKTRRNPGRELAFIGVDVLVAFVLGLLPGLDNFSHIGGFLMGFVLGICLLRSPAAISSRRVADAVAVDPLNPRPELYDTLTPSPKPMIWTFPPRTTFFTDRKGAWWAWWLVRVLALIGALVAFILLLKNFYTWGVQCSWCKYLSCLPVTVSGTNWCEEGSLDFQSSGGSTSNRLRRDGGQVVGWILRRSVKGFVMGHR